ncbi:MAG: citrate synthase [Halobacteriovoraceae bacterium]|nr:citrate synthase [Halobacteriovoraceae bacterium]
MSSYKLDLDGKSVELPIVVGTENEKGLDISNLRAETGYITLDNGYVNTGSCESQITFINGAKGILRYRGYPIEQLVEKSSFEEVSYLLYYGKRPNKSELEGFKAKIGEYSVVPKEIIKMIEAFPKDAHPMGMLATAVTALSGFYPEFVKSNLNDDEKNKALPLLMGAFKVISAAIYRHVSSGSMKLNSQSSLNYPEDFVSLMFDKSDEDVAKALDILLILHADHEQNCSASTVRMVGSSKANIFASIASGINALWGPLHGGANQAVIEMLDSIQADGGDYKKYIELAKDKSHPFRLMGFGHRVYKNFDPRAKLIKGSCDKVLAKLGVSDPVLDIAKGLEAEALKDPYFVERKLFPNVDFYSGIIYRALGIPTTMFTVMFALGRLPGWLTQWKEMIEGDSLKICRPRQIYTGETLRDFSDQ